MPKKWRFISRLGCVIGASCAIGCGRGDLPPMADVSGTATLDGAPLPDALITLMPTAGGRPSQGITDAQGEFEMSTFAIGDGALIGDHKVAVNPVEPPPPSYVPGRKMRGYEPPFPSRYWRPSSSGFTVTVDSGGVDDLKLELTSGD